MKISFDFDGTLSDQLDGTENFEKDKVIAKLRELQAEHHDIHIVSERYSPENGRKGLINEHIDVLMLAAELGIPGKNIHFTNREPKTDTLLRLSIDQHYEDSEHALRHFLANGNNSSLNFIMVNEFPWKIVNATINELSETE